MRASGKLAHWITAGIHWGGQAKTSYSDLRAEEIIQKSGTSTQVPASVSTT